jgi:hypothetical protein
VASLFAQLHISPPDYDTVEFPSKKETALAPTSTGHEYEREASMATRRLAKKNRRSKSMLAA